MNTARHPAEQNVSIRQVPTSRLLWRVDLFTIFSDFQEKDQLFYVTTRAVQCNEELLVWYSDIEYRMCYGVPVGLKKTITAVASTSNCTADNSSAQTEHGKCSALTIQIDIPTFFPRASDANGYQCDRCGKVFAYEYYRAKHLKYTRCVDMGDRKFPCHLCTRFVYLTTNE